MMNALRRDILHTVLDQLRRQPIPPISQQEFKRVDPESEVVIRIQRGSKTHYSSAGYFWLACILFQIHQGVPADPEWFLQNMLSDKYTTCQEISYEEFIEIVKWYDFVQTEHDFSLHGQFQQAWKVYDVGIEVAVLAETDVELVAFFWELLD